MSTIKRLLVAFALAGIMRGHEARAGEPGEYLVEKDGRKELKEPLVLREEQGGIAGMTGTEWTVEPSGHWKVTRILPGKEGAAQPPIREGTLSPAQVEALARAMAAQDLTALPEKTGREPQVNPRRVTLKFGKKTATLAGVPPRRGQTVAEMIRKGIASPRKEEADVWERFAHLSQAIESHCETPVTP